MACAEIRSIAEANLWCEHVAHGNNLVAKELAVRNIETIKLGACREAEVPVVDVVETIGGVAKFPLVGFVP